LANKKTASKGAVVKAYKRLLIAWSSSYTLHFPPLVWPRSGSKGQRNDSYLSLPAPL